MAPFMVRGLTSRLTIQVLHRFPLISLQPFSTSRKGHAIQPARDSDVDLERRKRVKGGQKCLPRKNFRIDLLSHHTSDEIEDGLRIALYKLAESLTIMPPATQKQ